MYIFCFLGSCWHKQSSHWKCSNWNGFLQSRFSMILPTESKGKLGNAGERVPFLVKLQAYSLQQCCQKWTLSQVFFRNFDKKAQNNVTKNSVLYVVRVLDMPLVKISVYTFNMFTSLVFWEIVDINRSSHLKCSDWKGFIQNNFSMLLPTESESKILGKC